MLASEPEPRPPVSSAPMWSVRSAVDCWSDWRSVLTARNSTPWTSASTMRLTALTPAPPTPTTRITGWPASPGAEEKDGSSRRRSTAPGRAAARSRTFSGISEEKAWRRRSCGEGICTSGSGSSAGALSAGWGRPVSRGWAGASTSACWAGRASRARTGPSPWRSSASSVLRNSAASGPSRMLARLALAMSENLLRELAIGLRGHAVGLVLEHRHALHGCLREADGLADPRGEHAVAEVFLEDLYRLLRVDRPRIDQCRQDTLDVDPGVEILPDHGERVLQLDETAHRQILALDGDDHLVGGREGVDRQQPQARRGVDADEVVVLEDRFEGLLQRALATDHRRHRDLRSGQVDRGTGDVDLALADDLADRDLVHEDV